MIRIPRLVAVIVEGWSMYPAYADGDSLLAKRRQRQRHQHQHQQRQQSDGPRARISAGTVVVVPRPDERDGWRQPPPPGSTDYFVKRVVASAGDLVPAQLLAIVVAQPGDRVPPGMFLIVGDHPLSRDSKQYGYCPEEFVVAIVLRRIGRSGLSVPPSVLRAVSILDVPQQGADLVGSRIAE